MEFVSIIVLAFLVEAIWTNLKMIWDKNKLNWNMVGSLIVAIIVAIGTKIDIFPVLGIDIFIPYLGATLTGILVSRGANVVYDLIKKITGYLNPKSIVAETLVKDSVEPKKEEKIEEGKSE